jgi:hypothetical protein
VRDDRGRDELDGWEHARVCVLGGGGSKSVIMIDP